MNVPFAEPTSCRYQTPPFSKMRACFFETPGSRMGMSAFAPSRPRSAPSGGMSWVSPDFRFLISSRAQPLGDVEAEHRRSSGVVASFRQPGAEAQSGCVRPM
jgi:hypothetical protein